MIFINCVNPLEGVSVCRLLSYVWLFVTPWTVAHQAPLPWDFPSKNTGVGNHSLLQGIFPTQGLNPGLLHYRQILYCLSQPGKPIRKIKSYINAHLWNLEKQYRWTYLQGRNRDTENKHMDTKGGRGGRMNWDGHLHTYTLLYMEKEMATHSRILARESRGQRSLVDYNPWGRKNWTQLSN